MMIKVWLTAQEAAEYLGVSIDAIHAWTCHKEIPHYKVNARVVRYKVSDLDDWLGQYRVMSNDEVRTAAAAALKQ